MTDFDFNNAPMGISDAASMFRREIKKNEKPYLVTVLKANNKMVDEWYDKVLTRIAVDKKIPAGRVALCWQIFENGKYLNSIIANMGNLPRMTEEQIKYWITFLSSTPIENLIKYGSGYIGLGYTSLMSEIKMKMAELKWELVYRDEENPYQWDQNANDNPKLFSGRYLPYEITDEMFRDIHEKVSTILANPVTPSN